MKNFIYFVILFLVKSIRSQYGNNPQPLIINGGNMPAVHVYHPIKKLPTIVKNTVEDFRVIEDLQKLSLQLDLQIKEVQ